MAEFSQAQKEFVVRCWAYRMGSSEIIKEFVASFPDAERPPSSQIARYKPSLKAGTTLSTDLKQLFDDTREAADADMADIDGFHQSFRFRELTDLYRMAKAQGSLVIAADILEQLAKEKGGMYSAGQRLGAGGSGAGGAAAGGVNGSGDTDRAEEINSLLDQIRERAHRDTALEGVSGVDPKP